MLSKIKSPKILFICYGNVGRSQIAEAYYNQFTNSKNAKSAGVEPDAGSKYHHPTKDIIDLMLEENIDISKNKVKPVTKAMIAQADKIIIFCDLDDCPKFLIDSKNIQHIPVADPYHIETKYKRAIRDEIKEIVKDLINSKS
jgi:protein-tyrosine-phosphatase